MYQVKVSNHIHKSCIYVLNVVLLEEENALFGILQNRILYFIYSKEFFLKET